LSIEVLCCQGLSAVVRQWAAMTSAPAPHPDALRLLFLGDVIGEPEMPAIEPLISETPKPVFFADDSALARKRIAEVLDRMSLPHQSANNGREAWEKLRNIASRADSDKVDLKELVSLILVDAEMPEMDGYVLTRHIKEDGRFKGIPVVMHSSLSSLANKKLGQQVGVDAYVAKFHADELSVMLTNMLHPA